MIANSFARARPWAGALLAATTLLLAGCGGENFESTVLRCAALPAATRSGDEELRRLVSLVRERGEAPDQWTTLPVPDMVALADMKTP